MNVNVKLNTARYCAVFISLAALFVLSVIWSINSGSVSIPVGEIWRMIFHKGAIERGELAADASAFNIIWKIRLPRLMLAAVLGGALSLSGFLLQTFFRNPIAGPFVLGISSGAKMFLAVVTIALSAWIPTVPVAVTVPTESSVGEKTVRATRSQKTQNTAPHTKEAGTMRMGFEDLRSIRHMCGTAMPTKEMGPAKAVTQAERTLERRMSSTRKRLTLTPKLRAYPSPRAYAEMGLDRRKTQRSVGMTMRAEIFTSRQEAAEKLPIDQWVRFTMSASFAKLMRKSVTAEQM